MKKTIILAAALSAVILSSCGNIGPVQNTVTTTTVTTAVESEAEEYASPEETQAREKLRKDTFIAEFWGQNISFGDTDALVKTATKDSSFEITAEKTSNQQKLAVKSKLQSIRISTRT